MQKGKPQLKQKGVRSAKWEPIINNIRNRKYSAAFRGLYKATPGSKRHLHRVIGNLVRKEIKKLLTIDDFPLFMDSSMENLSEFSWKSSLQIIEEHAPIVFHTLRAIVTSKKQEEDMMRNGVNLIPPVGIALATLLHARNPRKASFFPTVLSVQLWRGGIKRETLKQLSHAKLCIGYKGTVSAIDKVCESFDEGAKFAKNEIEEQLGRVLPNPPEEDNEDLELSIATSFNVQNVEEEINDSSDDELTENSDNMEVTDDEEESNTEDDDTESEEEETETVEQLDISGIEKHEHESEDMEVEREGDVETEEETVTALNPGFTFCWDNVGKKVRTRNPSIEKSNTYINMALGYMTMNRVPVTHLNFNHEDVIDAEDIHPSLFVPNEEDFHELNSRMDVIISRIITRHIPWFKIHFSDCAIPHILHANSAEMSRKSVLVNLGIFQENPSSTQGAIGIYRKLMEYGPKINDRPYPSIVYGDGLSCERGTDAQKAVCNGLSPIDRLEGLEPSPQEFHKEMLLLQDFYDEFFKGSSAADRGTLCHIKNVFNFRQVKNDISQCFTDSWELMCLITECFVVLVAMQILTMHEIDERPPTATEKVEDSDIDNRKKYLSQISKMIRKFVSYELNTNDMLKMDSKEGVTLYCCEEDVEEDMIGCCMGKRCAKGQWFHISCTGYDPDDLPTDFYCSDECLDLSKKSYPYCYCGVDSPDDEMIGCAAEDNCLQKEWYHLKCLNMSPENVPVGDWFCSEECKSSQGSQKAKRRKKTKEDHKFQYSKAFVWRRLNLMCRRDSVREGDGDAMLNYWRLDLADFFGKRHPKYVILAHRLLCATNGFCSDKIHQELVWNRTVNYSGGIGRNLPMDLTNELLNRLYKDLLESAKGRYTEDNLKRCGQIVGPLSESLDSIFDQKIIENELYRHRRRERNRDSNVQKLIQMMIAEKLFQTIPGRQHRAFPLYTHTENPKLPGQYLHKIRQLSKRLDRIRKVVLNG